MRRKTRITALVLALLLAVPAFLQLSVPTASAATTKQKLEEAKKNHAQIKSEMAEVQNEINALGNDKKDALAKKNAIDDQIELKAREIEVIGIQIDVYGELIAEREAELEELQRQEEITREVYKTRVRAMEENGSTSYYGIIFGASSFSDMLFRIDAVNAIMQYDQGIYDKLVTAEEKTEAKKKSVEDAVIECEASREELKIAQAELEEQQREAEELIAQIMSDINEAQKIYDEMMKDREAAYKEVLELEAKLKKEQAASTSTTVKGTGKFKWPVSSNYITSGFGARDTGIKGASTNHPGLDVGRVYYGSKIWAADSGTVTVSQKSSSYGNYVVISHGNGYTTLYAHMQSRSVKVGDKVTKGDLIGYTGSTGVSSGPHLHFEIWKNGVKVDPSQYFSNLVAAPGVKLSK
ncbi:MAG: peptidoglycan DD-metalloendopeptidase family protein [Oscillospiraceae bacterium]|nr:peptidoglycan DD-metalloendopeptidase family protein [Oscillospiraceae bacterium]